MPPLDSALIHKCEIQRNTPTRKDGHGKPVDAWATLAEDVACRLIEKSERAWSDQRQERIVSTRYVLLLPGNTVVQERDRFVNIVDAQGNEIHEDATFVVGAILTKRGATLALRSCELKVVS